MLSLTLNRISLFLSFVGVFVAGVLSYSHAAKVVPPCTAGDQHSCLEVTNSAFGKIGDLSLAYIGLAAYVVFVGLAVWRSFAADDLWKKLALTGVVLSGGGAIYSIWLQIVSFAGLGAKCDWCLSSAATMVLLFLVHAGMAQAGPPARREANRDLTLACVFCVLAFSLIGYQAATMPAILQAFSSNVELKGKTMGGLMPDKSKVRGDADAKVAVLEFADMMCGSCRLNSPLMHEVFVKYKGRLAWGYRHFPLFNVAGHENSSMLAMISEYAATKGKFWDFLDIVFKKTNDERIKSVEGIYAMAAEAGLDTADLKKEYDNAVKTEGKLLMSVNDDFTMASNQLKITGTPTFILLAEGVEPRICMPSQVDGLLAAEPYASLMK